MKNPVKWKICWKRWKMKTEAWDQVRYLEWASSATRESPVILPKSSRTVLAWHCPEKRRRESKKKNVKNAVKVQKVSLAPGSVPVYPGSVTLDRPLFVNVNQNWRLNDWTASMGDIKWCMGRSAPRSLLCVSSPKLVWHDLIWMK